VAERKLPHPSLAPYVCTSRVYTLTAPIPYGQVSRDASNIFTVYMHLLYTSIILLLSIYCIIKYLLYTSVVHTGAMRFSQVSRDASNIFDATLAHSHSLTLTHTHSLSLSLTLTHSHSLSLTLTHANTLTLTHSQVSRDASNIFDATLAHRAETHVSPQPLNLQGYLAHKKQRPPSTLQ